MSKVWIIQRLRHLNYDEARRYGEVEHICDINDEVYSDLSRMRTENKVLDFIDKFNPDDDYVLLSGDPVIIAMVFFNLEVGDRNIIRLLKWDARSGKYNPVNIIGN